ncbi:ATPase [Erythrobacteraceae bacterium CFH 75059]|uniref:ATPase n=1 Tax=Qipengyuania thermophila TaxID=2509361 RepID=UPI0010206FE7|nr:ATPase [Qipengyuania thermophila]TCD06331.1 ATPase [Erythrobacteraceae bacterium CFH 75059]
MTQLLLPLDPASAGAGDEAGVLIGTANAAAVEALARPHSWPYRTAVLSGPPRSGKTLLGRWFAAGVRAATVIDDAHREAEPVLFHAWNRAQEASAPLLLIAGTEPWMPALPDLSSRVQAALALSVGEPDDALLTALLRHHARLRRLVLDESFATYLVPRMVRSYAVAERLVAEIDRLSLELKIAPGRSVWRAALEAVCGPAQRDLA